MSDTTFRHGKPRMIDYEAGADIDAGEVLLAGNTTGLTCVIAHSDIANTKLGAVAAGGGVYDVINLDNAANYAKVWWDNSAKKATTKQTSVKKASAKKGARKRAART